MFLNGNAFAQYHAPRGLVMFKDHNGHIDIYPDHLTGFKFVGDAHIYLPSQQPLIGVRTFRIGGDVKTVVPYQPTPSATPSTLTPVGGVGLELFDEQGQSVLSPGSTRHSSTFSYLAISQILFSDGCIARMDGQGKVLNLITSFDPDRLAKLAA